LAFASFIPFESFPTVTIDEERKKLSKFINESKDRDQVFYARVIRNTLEKFNEGHPDDNIDIFTWFINNLIKMGCYREAISDIIESCFSVDAQI